MFEGGFLGLDNIGLFDRSAPLPTGGSLQQSDRTAWMCFFCKNMMEIALELAQHDPGYQDIASKFMEHFSDTIPQEERFVGGDVSTQSIMDVWNSDEPPKFAYPPRDRFTGSACYDCNERSECQSKAGYCFRDTFFNYGTVYGPPPNCPRAPDDGMRME